MGAIMVLDGMTQAGKTWSNATIGAIVTTGAYFIPVLHVIAPVFGGFIAGYLQKQGASGGMKVGGLKGIVMMIPAIGLSILASGFLANIPLLGELMAGSLLLLVVIVVGHSVLIGLIGGLFGGLIAGTETQRPAQPTT